LEGVVLDFGDQLALVWEPEANAYTQQIDTGDRDFSWQPVGAWAVGHSGWTFHTRGAVQFGGTPEIVHAAVRADGSRTVWWQGDYDAEQVFLQVRGPSGTWRCGSTDGRSMVPWWLAEQSGAELSLVARHTRSQLLPDGMIVTGHADLVVPVVRSLMDNADTRGTRRRSTKFGEAAGPRPMFEWQRWVTGGWRTRMPA
jgi:hypothetical protein